MINVGSILRLLSINGKNSRVAQWKRAGPITQRSVDRNHSLLVLLDKNLKLSHPEDWAENSEQLMQEFRCQSSLLRVNSLYRIID